MEAILDQSLQAPVADAMDASTTAPEGISAGMISSHNHSQPTNPLQMKSPSTTAKSGSGAYKLKKKSATLTSSS